MATSSENCTGQTEIPVQLSNYSLDPGYVLYLHHSDNPNCSLSTNLLLGTSSAQWKRSCEVSLTAKNKMSFVNGDYPKPPNGSQ